jgi:glycosyltransferase involved in cell wall biosynthesis
MQQPPNRTDERINVLFMQTQAYFGPDAQVHRLVMEQLDPERVTVHVACNAAPGSAALVALAGTPNIRLRPTNFGPTSGKASLPGFARAALRSILGALDLIRLARYARRNRIQIVHGTEKPRDVVFGYFISRCCGARSVTHLHVKVEDWIRPVARRLIHRSDGLIAVSQFVAESAVRMGYARERVYTVHNALDVSRWNPEVIDPMIVRQEFLLTDDVPLLCIVARINPWKGHELLLEALGHLHEDDVAFHLLIVGNDDPGGTPGRGTQIGRVQDLIASLNLGPKITLTGFRSDVAALLASSDIFTMPTWEEPFGLVFLEAMAMETPVVAIRSGAVIEVVEDGVTGLLSEPGDAGALASNIRRLIDDPSLRTDMGKAGRRRVIEEFPPVRLARGVEAAWRSVLASGQTRETRGPESTSDIVRRSMVPPPNDRHAHPQRQRFV